MQDSFSYNDHQPRRSPWRLVVIVLLIAVIGFAAWRFWPRGEDKTRNQPSPVVQVTTATRQDVPVYLDALGTVQAYNTATVRSQVEGNLVKIIFREGQDVKAGDLLAQIDPRTYQAQLDQAIAARDRNAALLTAAQRDLQRYINLGQDIAVQTTDTQRSTVAQLQAAVRADEAAIANARTMLSYTNIVSPIDGRTGIRQVDVGNLVRASDTNGIVVVTQLQPISVFFSLPQQNLAAINAQINQQEKLTVLALAEDNENLRAQGVLELVDNQIDPATGTVRLKAVFANDDHALWPGGFTNVRLLLTTQQNVIAVPTVAVQRGPQGTYVFALQTDNTVKIRPVKTGISEGENTIITEGIEDGEQIITDGMIKLQDGSKVTLPSEKAPNAQAD